MRINIAINGVLSLNVTSVEDFTPASVADQWLTGSISYTDAGKTLLCADGDLVYTWKDRTANGRDVVQATSGSRPQMVVTGGRSWIKWPVAGGKSLLGAWSPVSPNCEIFIRMMYANSSPYCVPFGLGGSPNQFSALIRPANGSVVQAFRGGVNASDNIAPVLVASTSGVVLIRGVGNESWSDSTSGWIGKVSLDGGTEYDVALTYAESQGSTQFPAPQDNTADLWISDYIVCDGPLSSGNRTKMLAWLAKN